MTVISAADVKPHLNMGASTVNNTEIEALIPGVEAAVAHRVGPLASTATTEIVDGAGKQCLVLPVFPVISVTSVTGKSGTVVTVTANRGWDNGMLWSDSVFGEDYYTVVYAAGWATVPSDITQALAKLTAADWVETHRAGDSSQLVTMLRGHAEKLLAPYVQAGLA